MSNRYYIDVGMLHKHHACSWQTTVFQNTFGKRMVVTPENLERAMFHGLSLNWPARTLAAETTDGPTYRHANQLGNKIGDIQYGRGTPAQKARKIAKLYGEVGDAWAAHKATKQRRRQSNGCSFL